MSNPAIVGANNNVDKEFEERFANFVGKDLSKNSSNQYVVILIIITILIIGAAGGWYYMRRRSSKTKNGKSDKIISVAEKSKSGEKLTIISE